VLLITNPLAILKPKFPVPIIAIFMLNFLKNGGF
jgi:hypothetical protein